MTVSIAIAVILFADIALLAGLAYVMSRASRLAPHFSANDAPALRTVPAPRRVAASPRRRARAELLTADS